MKFFQAITVLTLFAAVCACSGTKNGAAEPASTSAPAAQTVRIADPCKLLTQAEASEAIGAKLGPGELKRMGIITRCGYHNRARELELFLDVHNETAPEPDAVLFDSYTHMPNVKPVSGIGEGALWSHSDFGSHLDILEGGKLVEMGLPRTLTTITPAVEKAATQIASRM
jgi:hypothetical protein